MSKANAPTQSREEAILDESFVRTAALSRRLAERIEHALAMIDGGDEADTKSLLALVKSVQLLEELTRTMEKTIDERGREPIDLLEFRQKLETMLGALAQDENAL